jgi:hypothetical protein
MYRVAFEQLEDTCVSCVAYAEEDTYALHKGTV